MRRNAWITYAAGEIAGQDGIGAPYDCKEDEDNGQRIEERQTAMAGLHDLPLSGVG